MDGTPKQEDTDKINKDQNSNKISNHCWTYYPFLSLEQGQQFLELDHQTDAKTEYVQEYTPDDIKKLWQESLQLLVKEPADEEDVSQNVLIPILKDLPDHWSEKLSNYFNETARAYHNMYHINNLIGELQASLSYNEETLGRKCAGKDRLVLFLTVWFHDIVYDPQAKVKGWNEQESAKEFLNYWQEVKQQSQGAEIDPKVLQEIEEVTNEIILATIQHAVPDTFESQHSDSLDTIKQFLDMDLSILGQEMPIYADYCHRVRSEYQHYPNEAFLNGRMKVLKHLCGLKEGQEFGDKSIEMPQIYFSDWGQKCYQDKALTNMTQEYQWLQTVHTLVQARQDMQKD